MKIGSKIRPRDGKARRVTVHERPYVFAATADNKGDVHFVADVASEQHAETFLGSGDFYAFSKDMEQLPALTRGAPSGEAKTDNHVVGADGDGGQSNGSTAVTAPNPGAPTLAGHDAEAVAAAAELLKGSISDVGKAVGGHTLAVIRAALELEKASEPQRKGMVTLLEATIEGARQAGVAG